MNVISRGYLTEESCSSAIYTIVINDFKKKLAIATVGEVSTTEEFSVNWTKFEIRLYIAGEREQDKGYVSLFLYNGSDWMVRASGEVSVKVNKICLNVCNSKNVFNFV